MYSTHLSQSQAERDRCIEFLYYPEAYYPSGSGNVEIRNSLQKYGSIYCRRTYCSRRDFNDDTRGSMLFIYLLFKEGYEIIITMNEGMLDLLDLFLYFLKGQH